MIEWTLIVGLWLAVAATVIPFSRRGDWWIRACEFPRAQITCAAVVTLGLSYWRLDRDDGLVQITLLASGAAIGWQLCRMAPYSPLHRKQLVKEEPRAGEWEGLRLISANVYQHNRQSAHLLELIRRQAPEVVLLLETDDWWSQELAALDEDYPHSIKQPQDDTYGMILLSRLPLEGCEVRFLRRDHIPSIRCWLVLPSGRRVRFYGVHPQPPYPKFNDSSRQRDAELLTVAEEAREAGPNEPVIVMGDLNDVAWSRTTRLFQRISNLLDPRVGRYPMGTFPVEFPLFRFPLDHIFVSKHFALASFERLPNVQSDHFPVLCALQIELEAKRRNEAPEQQEGDEAEAERIHQEAARD